MSDKDIFKNGSTTYYWSSKFFPKKVREDVLKFYSFVRVVDDYVDQVPSDTKNFGQVHEMWEAARHDLSFDTVPLETDSLNEKIIKNLVYVVRKHDIDHTWIEAFFASMQMDINKHVYKTVEDSLRYMYGSAEVIGLVMSKIIGLPDEALMYARLQGRAMQYINFIRDIAEDNKLGRCYIPAKDLEHCGLKDLSRASARKNPEGFKKCLELQIFRYQEWQDEASEGFRFIPKKMRVPVATAADMYAWTAKQIQADPFIVFKQKVKPSKGRVITQAIANVLVS